MFVDKASKTCLILKKSADFCALEIGMVKIHSKSIARSFVRRIGKFAERALLAFCVLLLWFNLAPRLSAREICGNLDSLQSICLIGAKDTGTVRAMLDFAYCIGDTSLEKGIQLQERARDIAEEIGYQRGVTTACFGLSALYRQAGKYDEAIKVVTKGGKVAYLNDNKSGLIISLMELASSHEAKADYEQALHFLNIAKMMSKENPPQNLKYLGSIEQVSGIIYYKNRDYDAALEANQEALRIYSENNEVRKVAAMESNIGNVYFAKKDFVKAASIYKNAIVKALEQGDELGVGGRYMNYGAALHAQGKLDSALVQIEIGLNYARRNKDKRRETACLNNLAMLHGQMGDHKKSLEYALAALAHNREMGTKESEMNSLSNVGKAYELAGQPTKALEYFHKYVVLKDSLLGLSAAAKLAELRITYETEAKETEIKLLEAQSATLQSESARKTVWVITFISIAVALMLLIVSFIIRASGRRKVLETEIARQNAEFARKRADLEQRALRAQMNPHFLFNSLNAIQRQYVQGNIDKAGDFMSDFAQLLRKILDHSGSRRILITEEIETLRLYLSLEQARLDQLFEFEIVVDNDIDIFNTYMPPLIIQPFTENAIWHGIVPKGENGKIQVVLSALEGRADFDLLQCSVIDNGVGISDSLANRTGKKHHASKGMDLTSERLAPLGSVASQQLESGGTEVKIVIPLILDEN